MEEIVNRVEKSGLITLDLGDFYVDGERVLLDIKPWLYEEMIVREKEFRQHVQEHDWDNYRDKNVAIYCSADAIVPDWAYMLVSSKLMGTAKKVIQGDLNTLETVLFEESLNSLAGEDYIEKRVLVKGCGDKEISPAAYVKIVERLQPHVKSLMFGEACS